MTRDDQIERFLTTCGLSGASWGPLADDASFRRYFRVEGEKSLVLMDAPPDKEDIKPFMAIGAYLNSLGLSAPRVVQADLENGFLLLEDLGDNTFTRLLAQPDDAFEETLYADAIDVLAALHQHTPPTILPVTDGLTFTLPPYDIEAFWIEAALFTDWYLPLRTGEDTPPAARDTFEALWRDMLRWAFVDDPVLVLRDYHADNLMVLPDRGGVAQIGLLDFQDALAGPPAYDLVSLLQDCRRMVSPDLETAMLDRYIAAHPDLAPATFRTAYTVLGAQRQTKIIGIFTRLWQRDGKPAYPKMIPGLWDLLERDLDHPALSGLKDWFDQHCPPDLRHLPLSGEQG